MDRWDPGPYQDRTFRRKPAAGSGTTAAGTNIRKPVGALYSTRPEISRSALNTLIFMYFVLAARVLLIVVHEPS